jgi:hypothetical protein
VRSGRSPHLAETNFLAKHTHWNSADIEKSPPA